MTVLVRAAALSNYGQVARQVGDQLHGRTHPLENELVAGLHVRADQGIEALDGGNPRGVHGLALVRQH